MDTTLTLQLTIPAGTSLLDAATKQYEAANAIEGARQRIVAIGGSLVEVAAESNRGGRPHGLQGRKRSEESKAKQRAYWAQMSPTAKAERLAKLRAGTLHSGANGHAA